MEDEIWVTKDGRKIAVSDMSENHVRNALRMILRNARKKRERVMDELLEGWVPERLDNHAVLAGLQQQYRGAVRTEGKSVGGMNGSDVYVNDRWVGWFGGV